MKLKSEYTAEKLAGRTVLMPAGQAVLDGKNIYTLNESAKWYLELLKEERSFDELISLAAEKYGAETPEEIKMIAEDLEHFLGQLREKALLED